MSEHTVVKYRTGKYGVVKDGQIVKKLTDESWIVKTSKGSKGASYAAKPISTFANARDAHVLAKELAKSDSSSHACDTVRFITLRRLGL